MANLELDDLEFQHQFELAQLAATKVNLTEPRAIAAYYDRTADTIAIRLRSGAIKADDADMRAMIMVGSSQTRILKQSDHNLPCVHTPRRTIAKSSV